jgi:hypothetical protein
VVTIRAHARSPFCIGTEEYDQFPGPLHAYGHFKQHVLGCKQNTSAALGMFLSSGNVVPSHKRAHIKILLLVCSFGERGGFFPPLGAEWTLLLAYCTSPGRG